jgi:hypothetical protein
MNWGKSFLYKWLSFGGIFILNHNFAHHKLVLLVVFNGGKPKGSNLTSNLKKGN